MRRHSLRVKRRITDRRRRIRLPWVTPRLPPQRFGDFRRDIDAVNGDFFAFHSIGENAATDSSDLSKGAIRGLSKDAQIAIDISTDGTTLGVVYESSLSSWALIHRRQPWGKRRSSSCANGRHGRRAGLLRPGSVRLGRLAAAIACIPDGMVITASRSDGELAAGGLRQRGFSRVGGLRSGDSAAGYVMRAVRIAFLRRRRSALDEPEEKPPRATASSRRDFLPRQRAARRSFCISARSRFATTSGRVTHRIAVFRDVTEQADMERRDAAKRTAGLHRTAGGGHCPRNQQSGRRGPAGRRNRLGHHGLSRRRPSGGRLSAEHRDVDGPLRPDRADAVAVFARGAVGEAGVQHQRRGRAGFGSCPALRGAAWGANCVWNSIPKCRWLP